MAQPQRHAVPPAPVLWATTATFVGGTATGVGVRVGVRVAVGTIGTVAVRVGVGPGTVGVGEGVPGVVVGVGVEPVPRKPVSGLLYALRPPLPFADCSQDQQVVPAIA